MDCNPVEGGICVWPTGYKWCSWSMATNGDPRNDKLGGGKRDAPTGVVAVAPPEKYAFQLEKGKSSVAENILEILQGGAMSAAEIGATLGMKSRHRLITGYLQPLVKMKLLEQTLPNSPRAPNQKYRLAS